MKSRKKSLIEKITNYFLNILIFIFGIFLLISLYTSVQNKLLGNDYTNFFGYSLFEVQTGSMEDVIGAGDWIVVNLTSKVKLKDIVTYKLDGEYITHRIIEVYNGTYITKGDANSGKDEPIDQSQIVGKVVKILPNFGIIKKTLLNPGSLIALIITLFLFNFALKKNKKEDSNKALLKGTNKKTLINIISEKIRLIKERINKKSKISANNQKATCEIKTIDINEKKIDLNEIKKEEVIEDELSKTAFYRVISVDASEVSDKFKPLKQETKEVTKEELEEKEPKTENIIEDELGKTSIFKVTSINNTETVINSETVNTEEELEKTSLFRVIPVKMSEIDDTFLEIAKNEIKVASKKEPVKEIIPEPKQVEDKYLTKINLNLLKNDKNRKGKNIIDTVMIIKKEELDELINIIVKEDETYINKPTIKNQFVTTYIDAKYYNHYIDKDLGKSDKATVIKKVIKDIASELVNSYKGKDTKYNNMVYKYANMFILIANLEQANELVKDTKATDEFYKKELEKYSKNLEANKIERLTTEIIKIQKKYTDILEAYLKKLETNMFNLNINKLNTKKDIYGLGLEHNISFSKVYSDYIIDKTYTEGIIAEDKMMVLLTLLSVQLINDMISSDFNKKYIFYVSKNLYAKEKKLDKLLKMLDDEYAKNNVIILISFDDLLKNKQVIKRLRNNGYRFAIAFDKQTIIKEKNRGDIYIADYVFINKKMDDVKNIIAIIPEELLDKVIYEDIINKVGDFGGE